MIAIIDYGVGNLFSLQSSFAAIGQEAVVTRDIEEIRRADRLILPGVGAFGDAAEKLRETGLGASFRNVSFCHLPFLLRWMNGGFSRLQPFTLPSAMPVTKYFCRKG